MRVRTLQRIFVGVLLAVPVSAPARALTGPAVDEVARHLITYKSEGRPIRLEEFRPAAIEGSAPAVILLHGASGIRHGALIYGQAQALAENGIVAYVLHYFDGMTGGAKAKATKFPVRDQIIEDALAYVSQLPQVDDKRIGLFGFSLGAFHALGLATKDERVIAVVAIGGGMPNQIPRDEIEKMPPTLIVHGARDRVVPVKRAREVASIMQELGADFDMVIWSGQQHMPKGLALEGTLNKVVAFFEQQFARTIVAIERRSTLDIRALVPDVGMLAPL